MEKQVVMPDGIGTARLDTNSLLAGAITSRTKE